MGMNDSVSRTPRARRPRRTPVLMAGAVAALLVGLSACGSSDDSDSSASASSSGGAADGAFPAKVATKFGEVTVDKAPKRIVALGWGDAETVLALGGQPVGASDWLAFGGEGVGPWAKGKYDKTPQIIGTMEPEYEKIAALQPDLILDTKSSGDKTRYDTLSKIAPTVGVPKGGDQYMISWEKQTEMISAALGVKDKGDKLIADTEAKFEAAAKAHPEFKGSTIALGSRTSEGYGAYVSGTGRMDFVERLGFKNSPAIQAKAGKGFSVSISKENLDLLDADLTVMSPIGIPATDISNDPLYKAVPSVKAGHSLVFDDEGLSQAFATDSVLSTVYALDKVVPLFAEKMK
ncbi:ABC transporter substrate-binding protein [Streptomyces sp. SID8360]|nr:periplasmic binding protein [Streptomyces sp. SirexAA-E]MYT62890.1 ABC transporter substrate-binding protein [Streptomyces sp. SID8357]MYT88834.1 ABC transporter substrate-binding protein [Streptomyces sp. SID8360]MYW40024.1 ABC transporter substrate-binding protein [Streptomyces sp. SID1]PZX38358.1 iron complex transport system substrate-binding protein [Streptomyces sp. DvalAA-21]RAJ34691.1 iron complex transport system substrate-binding protein [Streptomyces sp. DpondAA-E10]RAJ49503.1 i